MVLDVQCNEIGFLFPHPKMYADTDACGSFMLLLYVPCCSEEMEANECVAHGYVLQVTDDTGGS